MKVCLPNISRTYLRKESFSINNKSLFVNEIDGGLEPDDGVRARKEVYGTSTSLTGHKLLHGFNTLETTFVSE